MPQSHKPRPPASNSSSSKPSKPPKPSTNRRTATADAATAPAPAPPSTIPTSHLDQALLDIFRRALSSALADPAGALHDRVQAVKGRLYERDFDAAFGAEEELREAYVARWSPGRALAYVRIWEKIGLEWGWGGERVEGGADRASGERGEHGQERVGNHEAEGEGTGDGGEASHRQRLKIVALGAGSGAELVSLAGWMRILELRERQRGARRDTTTGHDGKDGETSESISAEEAAAGGGNDTLSLDFDALSLHPQSNTTESPPQSSNPSLNDPSNPSNTGTPPLLSLHLLDRYSWRPTQISLLHAIHTPPSTSTTTSPPPLLPRHHLHLTTQTADLLALSPAALARILTGAHLVTLFFTLNELVAASLGSAIAFLRRLAACAALAPGARIVVVDSAGSYADVPVGAGKSRYPMGWALDYGLLGEDGRTGGGWERVMREESYWVRLPEGLRYPVRLEDMRCQIHVYRKV